MQRYSDCPQILRDFLAYHESIKGQSPLTISLDPATAEKVLNLTKKIVSERNITCLMVTHNMHQALELGNRTLMMDSGNIVLDITGEERKKMTVDDLLEQFAVRAGKELDNDRILFSKVEGSNS